ncbi:helix-turn-helix domain-containing protein [Bifidobacterium amazonense]|uniref:Helix-turn-helix domain-containing protein n=1 Tax=Bifidobacterium amazonense TaxID=2809027 RepID=A0ABS9VU55_9BIFI|nr:helix-turn-helix domain-containing protein [Bifidobacterium amazonense]MCH9275608.1 helix-turn-helix domain-containing protein [Bifidobacterium amazonense]
MTNTTDTSLDPLRLLSPAQVSQLTGIPIETLSRWRKRNANLPYLHMGRNVRYRAIDIQHWIEQHMITPTRTLD